MFSNWISWFTEWSLSYGHLGLSVFSFVAALFLPVPTEAVLIPLMMLHPERTLLYALNASVSSTMAGWVAYGVGRWLGVSFLKKRVEKGRLAAMREKFQHYGVWAVGLAALTPLPYNLFALAAGVFRMSLPVMLLSAFAGRFLRFGLEGLGALLFGELIVPFLSPQAELAFFVAVLLIGGLGFFFGLRRR